MIECGTWNVQREASVILRRIAWRCARHLMLKRRFHRANRKLLALQAIRDCRCHIFLGSRGQKLKQSDVAASTGMRAVLRLKESACLSEGCGQCHPAKDVGAIERRRFQCQSGQIMHGIKDLRALLVAARMTCNFSRAGQHDDLRRPGLDGRRMFGNIRLEIVVQLLDGAQG